MTLGELLIRLDEAAAENASAFVAVALDGDGNVMRATGPFDQPEQALAAGAEAERRWNKERSCVEDGSIRHVVVPLWEAGE